MHLILFILFFSLPGIIKADDWPGWLGPKRDGVWREEGIIKNFPENGPKILWRIKINRGATAANREAAVTPITSE